MKIQCAQCHNHPFAKWDKKHFWEMAAFFLNGFIFIMIRKEHAR